MGQFADDGTFVVNEHTGEIFATKSLDRDPSSQDHQSWTSVYTGHNQVEGRCI